jgi:hypothetical protein
LRDVFTAVCIPSAAKAGYQNRFSSYGLKPVPFKAKSLDRLSVNSLAANRRLPRRFRLTLPMRLELDRVLHDIQNLLSFRSSAGRSFLSFYGHCARLGARPILQQQFARLDRGWADVFFLA